MFQQYIFILLAHPTYFVPILKFDLRLKWKENTSPKGSWFKSGMSWLYTLIKLQILDQFRFVYLLDRNGYPYSSGNPEVYNDNVKCKEKGLPVNQGGEHWIYPS